MSATLKEWEQKVEEKWEYWEHYREMYDFSLSKAANSIFTKWIYPVFYQERLLKKEFVENMQMLGELTPDEIKTYEKFRDNTNLNYAFNYFRKPTGGFYGIFNLYCFGLSVVGLPYMAYKTKKTFAWYVVPSMMFMLFSHMLIYTSLHSELPEIVDMTQWAIEKRKAKVWLEEKNHPQAKIAPLLILQKQVIDLTKH